VIIASRLFLNVKRKGINFAVIMAMVHRVLLISLEECLSDQNLYADKGEKNEIARTG
jgi:hypothetical protein